MSEMKSAFERAMERADKIGKATPEELRSMEAVPEGNQLASKYMREPVFDLAAAIDKHKGTGMRKPVIDGAMEIFVRYLTLPTGGNISRETVEKAKKGILVLKENKRMVQEIFSQIDNLLNYYEQARQQLVAQMKQAFEQQAGMQRGFAPPNRADPASQPQFREEIARRLGDLNRQYEQALEEQRQRIMKAP